MNQRKKLLWGLTLGLLMVGVGVSLTPFVSALKPPVSAGEGLPHIDISQLPENEFMIHDVDDKWWMFSTRYMIVRFEDENFYIYFMGRNKDGATMLPDLAWWRPGWPCQDFRPNTIAGKISANSVIQCFDQNYDYRPDITWKITGESIDHNYGAMDRIEKYTVEGKYLIVGKG